MDDNPYKAPEASEELPPVKHRLWLKLSLVEWATIVVILGVLYLLMLPASMPKHHPRRAAPVAQEKEPADPRPK